MKKLSLLLALTIGLCSAAVAQTQRQLPIPPIGPLPAFHPQEPKRIQLPNGMVIFLMEDHELPIIGGHASIRGGERDVPADVPRLLVDLGDATPLQVLDLGWIDVVPGEQRVHDLGSEVVAANVRQRPVLLPDRAANGVDD